MTNPAIDRMRAASELTRLMRDKAALPAFAPALERVRIAAAITAQLQKMGVAIPIVSIYNSGIDTKELQMSAHDLDTLTAAATKAMEAETPNKWGTREGVASVKLADGREVLCTMSEGKPSGWRNRHSGLVRKVQYKLDGKVASKATLLDVLGGKAKREINEELRSAFEAQAPMLAEEYAASITRSYEYQTEKHGGALPAYPDHKDPARQMILQTIAPHCDMVDPNPAGMSRSNPDRKPYALVLNKEKLAKIAKQYAELAAVQWFYKTNAKLGALANPELHYDKGGDVRITGTRGGKDIRMEQQRILKASPLGNLFHQFPARIYVDGKFTTEADYLKQFKD